MRLFVCLTALLVAAALASSLPDDWDAERCLEARKEDPSAEPCVVLCSQVHDELPLIPGELPCTCHHSCPQDASTSNLRSWCGVLARPQERWQQPRHARSMALLSLHPDGSFHHIDVP